MADSLFPVDGSLAASNTDDVLTVAALSTDKADYAPGETATITASGFAVGSTITFTLADDPST